MRLILLLTISLAAQAQFFSNPVRVVQMDPSGACSGPRIALSAASGDLFYCDPSTNMWAVAGTGGGGDLSGTVSTSGAIPFVCGMQMLCEDTNKILWDSVEKQLVLRTTSNNSDVIKMFDMNDNHVAGLDDLGGWFSRHSTTNKKKVSIAGGGNTPYDGGVQLTSDSSIKWNDGDELVAPNVYDIGICRLSTNVLEIIDGECGGTKKGLHLNDLRITGLAGGGTQCLEVDNDGDVATSACAAGTGDAATFNEVMFSTTPTFTCNSNTAQKFLITLTDNVSSSTLACTDEAVIVMRICQDGMGSRTFAWDANFVNPGTVDGTANSCTNQIFFYDATSMDAVAAGPPWISDITGSSIVLSGATSGTTTIAPDAVASGIVTLKAGTYDLVGTSLTQTLTGKTLTSPTINDGTLDLGSGLLEVPNSTSLPGTCTPGQVYFDTDATSGQRFYACNATDSWVALGAGGGGAKTTYRLPVGVCASDASTIASAGNWITAVGSPGSFLCNGVGTNVATPYSIFDNAADDGLVTWVSLPPDWNSGEAVKFNIYWAGNATGNANVTFEVRTACLSTGTTTDLFDAISYNTAQTVTTGEGTVVGQRRVSAISALTMTGCSANDLLQIQVNRDVDDASADGIYFMGADITLGLS